MAGHACGPTERQNTPLWEQPALRAAAGNTLRPGGFVLTDRAAEHMGAAPGWRAVDVGCGLGATVSRLRSRYGVTAWGVEPSAKQLSRAKSLPGPSTLLRANAAALPFQTGCLDAVFCECVFSLLPDQRAALCEFHRVLRPGGFLVLSDLCAQTPNCRNVTGNETDMQSCAVRARPLAEVCGMVGAEGFALSLVQDHSHLLRDLGARLIFAGNQAEISETATSCHHSKRLGYYLLIGHKKEHRTCLTTPN